jgi:CRP-like cAMP-binding protein
LASLPPEVRQRLQTAATRVPLRRDDVLAEAGVVPATVFFPLSGLVSLQTITEDGNTIEVASAGRDSLIGLPIGVSTPAAHNALVLLEGEALRVRADVIRAEFARTPELQAVILEFWQREAAMMAVRSACHRFHTARQRLARWLLDASDLTGSGVLDVTQERLAAVLGVQRTNVTTASVSLQDSGAIRARHGRITVLSAGRLLGDACGCSPLT